MSEKRQPGEVYEITEGPWTGLWQVSGRDPASEPFGLHRDAVEAARVMREVNGEAKAVPMVAPFIESEAVETRDHKGG